MSDGGSMAKKKVKQKKRPAYIALNAIVLAGLLAGSFSWDGILAWNPQNTRAIFCWSMKITNFLRIMCPKDW